VVTGAVVDVVAAEVVVVTFALVVDVVSISIPIPIPTSRQRTGRRCRGRPALLRRPDG